jgi:hypothetical protein
MKARRADSRDGFERNLKRYARRAVGVIAVIFKCFSLVDGANSPTCGWPKWKYLSFTLKNS